MDNPKPGKRLSLNFNLESRGTGGNVACRRMETYIGPKVSAGRRH